jgi:hypothetical protein
MINRIFLLVFLFGLMTITKAQTDTTKKFHFSGYAELYYRFDFSRPETKEKPSFIYNHKRHNEINTNLILLKSNYQDDLFRANAGLMAGNYARYNLSGEPNWAKFIYEANVGLRLSKKQNIWIDAGIMPSHIGFESAISAECWTLTRNILAENSPYYESGVKLGYTNRQENINISFLVLNGWQRIHIPSDFRNPSWGIQVNVKPTKNLTLNYSNFLGNALPDSFKSFRTYHNFYLIYESDRKLGAIFGFDLGTESNFNNKPALWYTPAIILQYKPEKNTKLAVRGEYFNDKNEIIVPTSTQRGFSVFGASANLDYKITRKIICRLEGKLYTSKDRIFNNEQTNAVYLSVNTTIRL